MFSDQLSGVSMIFENVRKFQMRPAKAEIDGGFIGLADEFGQVVTGAKPSENPFTLPAPRDDFLAGKIGRDMPVVFLGEAFDAAMHSIIVPSERNEHPPS